MFDIFGNGTIPPPVNWQPDALTRGTSDILSTCLITLGLCLWSALHLNIPQHGKSAQQKWYKCGWLVLGLFAPEMVAYMAWAQLRVARKLDNKMKQLLGEAPNSSLRAENNSRVKSTAGRDLEEGDSTEQHDESQIGQENPRPRQLNVARGDPSPGTASHEIRPRADEGPEGGHCSVVMDPKLNSSKIAVAGNRRQLLDEDRDNGRRTSCGSETRHQINLDEVDTDLQEEYSGPSPRQSESAEPTTLADGKTNLKTRRHPWTMTHSFYAIMGGFAFDTSDAEPNFLPNHRSRLCISVYGLSYIAKKAPELIPEIAEQQIKDKSKADSMAKFIVCLQALWFCVQCITRVSQRKAISLLELNTFAHAFCALLIYALWWHKPQDIEEPTLLQGQKEWEMCAFLCMNSGTSSKWGSRVEADGGPEFGMTACPPMVIQWAPDAEKRPAPASNRILNPGTDSISPEKDHDHRIAPGEGPGIMLGYSDVLYGFQSVKRGGHYKFQLNHGGLWIESPRLRRLELYSNAIKSFRIADDFLPDEQAVCDAMPNWPLDEHFEECTPLKLWEISPGTEFTIIGNEARLSSLLLGLILAGLLYGGLHLLAWKVPFASRAERILWRFSGILITSAGVGFAGLRGYYNAGLDLLGNWGDILIGVGFGYWGLCMFAMCMGYLLARTFLVVECFLQLSRLPASAYETLEWSVYFPHIT
ncbi:hypothetical protein JMJ35_006586 [Cladonia borealis]|uniref:Uncharacterized protein n=1 Tax=Cladonia borealis TaxID=184061 RepID=A0AA39V4B1_9LECA|nr:hypothetical protein JMJ35_006586 [Cladonia borealis]